MTITDTAAPADSRKHGHHESPITNEPIPPDCSPDRFPDWRLRYGHHLAEHTTQRPIEHDDPWVQTIANAFAHHLDGLGEPEPMPTNLAIAETLRLYQRDTLERHLLDARLLAQEEPEEIAQRSRLSLLTITAYAHLVFDVRGTDRKGIWFLRRFRLAGPARNPKIWMVGQILKQVACFNPSETLEDHIDVLCRLDGKTMADGLPDRTAPEFAREFVIRQTLAAPLLPENRSTRSLLQRFDEATANDVQAGRSSDETVSIGIEILRRAKIPAALRKEIRRARDLNALAPEAAPVSVHPTPNPDGTISSPAALTQPT